MAKKRIFCVGFSLPGDQFEDVDFNSNQTLLDADIILFEPTFGNGQFEYGMQCGGKPILDEYSSFATKGYLDHWRGEIGTAIAAGKLVIVYLVEPVECYRYTGTKSYSGTGRSRITQPHVVTLSSYEAIPVLDGVAAKLGSEVRLEKAGKYLAPYWSEFEGPYEVEIAGKFSRVVLRAQTGERIVGAALHSHAGGVLLFLPPLSYDESKFVRGNEDDEEEAQYWTGEALKFGKRLAAALVSLAEALKQSAQITPPPDWSMGSDYCIAAEKELECEISGRAAAIAKLQAEKADLESQAKDAGSLRQLLYEQGMPLENAVLEAMRLFGFEAQSFSDGESEFDGLFLSSEGRCLGEIEDRDNKAINIEKFSQLERNLQEDFERDAVTEHAKGLLLGNAYRLKPVSERGEFFTAKCVSAAKRIGAALIRTPDMFASARYLKENPSDTDYAQECRAAIYDARGEVVFLPPPPVDRKTMVGEIQVDNVGVAEVLTNGGTADGRKKGAS